MGYIYTKDGRLCCDFCGKSGGVRKYKCPFGWCQSYAFCPECARKHQPRGSAYRKKHRASGCEQASARYKAEQAEREAILESGAWLRCAAVGVVAGVKVWFKTGDGGRMEALMSHATYDAISIHTPSTLEDYREHGKVTVTFAEVTP